MRLTVSTKEDLIGFMDDWDPSKGNALQYARSLFPNSYAAIEAAMKQAESVSLPGNDNLCFTMTMFVHHSKVAPPLLKKENVRKVKGGFTGAVHIYKNDMRNHQGELPAETIEATVLARLNEQTALLLSRADMQP